MGKGGSSQMPSGPVYSHDQNAINQQQQLQNQAFYQAQLEANRARAMQQGRNLGQELFGHGTMPRLREGRSQEQADLLAQRRAATQVAGQRSSDVANLLGMRMAGLGGYSSPEYQALRSQAYEGLQNQLATGQRNLNRAQSQTRLSGAAATAQNSRLQQAAQAEAAKQERDLYVQNIDEQQRRLAAYQDALTGAENTEWGRYNQAFGNEENTMNQIMADELAREQYNNNVYNRETAGQYQSMLGMMGIGSGDLASAAQSAIAQQQMNQAQAQNGGGGKGK